MMKLCFVLCILFSCFACHKDNDTTSLNGNYTETNPVAGRTKMNFTNGNTVTIIKDINSGFTPDTNSFHYHIANGKIQLVLLPDGVDSTNDIDFTILNNTSFQTGNLYLHIPEAPPVTITFTK